MLYYTQKGGCMTKEYQKKGWQTPRLSVYGTIGQITLQFKCKSFGGGDDVLVNNEGILSDAS